MWPFKRKKQRKLGGVPNISDGTMDALEAVTWIVWAILEAQD